MEETTPAAPPYRGYHLHLPGEPWCVSFSKEDAEAAARAAAEESGGVVVGPLSYSHIDCSYVNDQLPHKKDGTVAVEVAPINLHEIPCPGCGKPMDGHVCPDGSTPVVIATRSTGPRKRPEDHPVCGHCGGRAHWNNPEFLINSECLLRQYSLETGLISSPYDKIKADDTTLQKLGEWITAQKKAGIPLTYGKMLDGSGKGGSFSGMRPPTPRKERKPAPEGTRIEDMAKEATPPKPRKVKGKAANMPTTVTISDEVVPMEPDEDDEVSVTSEAAAPVEDVAGAARKAAEERREKRKKLLAGRS